MRFIGRENQVTQHVPSVHRLYEEGRVRNLVDTLADTNMCQE